MVGDPKQLPTTTKSKNKNTDDDLGNPFADQNQIGFMTRLQNLGFRMPMFIEQFRLTEGLEEFSNTLFYDRRLRNALCIDSCREQRLLLYLPLFSSFYNSTLSSWLSFCSISFVNPPKIIEAWRASWRRDLGYTRLHSVGGEQRSSLSMSFR